MAIRTVAVVRQFSFNGVTLPDPGPAMSPEAVKDLYSANYAALINAAIEGPTMNGNVHAYKFVTAVKVKGATGSGERAFRESLRRASAGESPGAAMGGVVVDLNKLTEGEQSCGKLLLWLSKRTVVGNQAVAHVPANALVQLP